LRAKECEPTRPVTEMKIHSVPRRTSMNSPPMSDDIDDFDDLSERERDIMNRIGSHSAMGNLNLDKRFLKTPKLAPPKTSLASRFRGLSYGGRGKVGIDLSSPN
jgi:hypothetical protein